MNKVPASLHVLIGTTPISIAFPTDAAAENQWRIVRDLLVAGEETTVVIHDGGTVLLRLASVSALTWTKERRVPMPGHGGIMVPPPGMVS